MCPCFFMLACMKQTPFTTADLLGPTLPPAERELRLIAVMSLSGAAAVEGTSESLGNDIDAALLTTVRAWSDVVLVGAGTARAETYSGVKCSESERDKRVARGQAPVPPIAVLTKSFDFDPSSQLFTDTEVPPVFLAPQASLDDPGLASARQKLLDANAQLISTGDGSAHAIIDALHTHGFNRITCEGGPGLYGTLLAAGLGDVLHLTIDPLVHGNVETTLFSAGGNYKVRLALEDVHASDDSVMFCRYRRTDQ